MKNRLKVARAEKDLTQEDLAKRGDFLFGGKRVNEVANGMKKSKPNGNGSKCLFLHPKM